jgi:hypothetical protein
VKVKRYSWRTVKSYLYPLRFFLAAHPELTLDEVTSDVLRTYLVGRVAQGNFAASSQGQMLNTGKFWLAQVEGQDKTFVELRPKKRERPSNHVLPT